MSGDKSEASQQHTIEIVAHSSHFDTQQLSRSRGQVKQPAGHWCFEPYLAAGTAGLEPGTVPAEVACTGQRDLACSSDLPGSSDPSAAVAHRWPLSAAWLVACTGVETSHCCHRRFSPWQRSESFRTDHPGGRVPGRKDVHHLAFSSAVSAYLTDSGKVPLLVPVDAAQAFTPAMA